MKRKLLVFDVDNTLVLHGSLRLPRPVRQTLCDIAAAGHLLVPATGRPWWSTDRLFKGVPLTTAVCANGTATVWPNGPSVLRTFGEERTTFERLVELARHQGSKVFLIASRSQNDGGKVSHHETNVFGHARVSLNRMRVRRPILTRTPDILALVQPACRVAFFSELEYGERVHEAVQGIMTKAGNPLYYYPKEGVVEVLPLRCSKASALEEVRISLGVDHDDIIVCGDGWNDLEMLQWGKTRVVMGHAPPQMQALADHIVTPWDEGQGFNRFLREYFFE